MNALAWNLLLALVWVLLSGSFTGGNFLVGFVFGYLILAFADRSGRSVHYVRKVPQVLKFALFFLWDLVKANLRVAYDVVTPTHRMRPAVIGIPLELESEGAITLLANLITVTPGTLALDISPDRRTLYIHAMYMDDEATLRAEIKALEQRVRELIS
jgi:multicomponent Na+:H+ antiporter subunit E